MYSCYIKKHITHSYDDKRYVKVLFMKMRIMDSEYLICIHDNNSYSCIWDIYSKRNKIDCLLMTR